MTWSNTGSLTLSAYNDININAAITNNNTTGAPVVLRADNTGIGNGTVNFNFGGTVSTLGRVSIFYNPSAVVDEIESDEPDGDEANKYQNPTTYTNTNLGGTLTAYMLVNSAADLQLMGTGITARASSPSRTPAPSPAPTRSAETLQPAR